MQANLPRTPHIVDFYIQKGLYIHFGWCMDSSENLVSVLLFASVDNSAMLLYDQT